MLRNQVGISNDLASLLYSRSSAEIITSRTLVSSLDAMTMKWQFSIINAAVQCHILRTFEEKIDLCKKHGKTGHTIFFLGHDMAEWLSTQHYLIWTKYRHSLFFFWTFRIVVFNGTFHYLVHTFLYCYFDTYCNVTIPLSIN
jgi:hypothetical protein